MHIQMVLFDICTNVHLILAQGVSLLGRNSCRKPCLCSLSQEYETHHQSIIYQLRLLMIMVVVVKIIAIICHHDFVGDDDDDDDDDDEEEDDDG